MRWDEMGWELGETGGREVRARARNDASERSKCRLLMQGWGWNTAVREARVLGEACSGV